MMYYDLYFAGILLSAVGFLVIHNLIHFLHTPTNNLNSFRKYSYMLFPFIIIAYANLVLIIVYFLMAMLVLLWWVINLYD